MSHRRSITIGWLLRQVLGRAALGVLVVLGGCRDGVSPAEVTGTYVLEQVGDDPVPAMVFRDGSASVHIIADTLRLRASGRGSFVSVRVIEQPIGGPLPAAATRLQSELTWRISDSRVEMAFVCPANANCAPGPHLIGRRTTIGMVIEQTLLADADLIYRKLPGLSLFPD